MRRRGGRGAGPAPGLSRPLRQSSAKLCTSVACAHERRGCQDGRRGLRTESPNRLFPEGGGLWLATLPHIVQRGQDKGTEGIWHLQEGFASGRSGPAGGRNGERGQAVAPLQELQSHAPEAPAQPGTLGLPCPTATSASRYCLIPLETGRVSGKQQGSQWRTSPPYGELEIIFIFTIMGK